MRLKIIYLDNGKPFSVNYNRGSDSNPMWAVLPFDPSTKSLLPPSNEIEELLVAEAQALPEWESLVWSDRAPDPPAPIDNPLNEYLKKSEAVSIAISYSPTPENSEIEAHNVQGALDEAITRLGQMRGQINLLLANTLAPIFFDALNDVDNKSLDAHIPNTPCSTNLWNEVVGNWSIVNNQARSDGTLGSLTTYECGFGLKASFEADVTIVDSTSPQGIIFRYANSMSYWRAVYSKSSGGRWLLNEIIAGGVNSRVNIPAPGITLGQTYKFKVLLDGNNISFLVNDQLTYTWTSTNNITATKFGLYSSSAPTKFKNCRVLNLG